eukprot:5960447-Pleurochrysis_carterae.AAC.1
MIRRRMLGHIDGLLRVATQVSDSLFGGLNIIFIGDHGQLPPEKDMRMFKKISIEFVSPQNAGNTMQGAASIWARRGLDAYNAVWTKGLVFFWMLSSGCKQQVVHPQHQRHEENFKALQHAPHAGRSGDRGRLRATHKALGPHGAA